MKVPERDEIDLLLERMRLFAEETGANPTSCIHEALTDWLECTAEPQLEAFRKQDRNLTLAS